MSANIFITGATGNVGGKLVPTIFRQIPEATITLLVRDLSQQQAYNRAMHTISKLTPAFDLSVIKTRLKVVCGDLTKPKLGMVSHDYDNLAKSTTHIIHSAAATKFRMPADEARATNYDGTRHTLEFGLRSAELGGLRRFAYISTAYACGESEGRIFESPFDGKSEFSNIYERTKWEAEQYLYRFRDNLPLDIFRPSIIVGDSRTGLINDFNVLYAPLRLILTGRIRILPCRPDIPLDIIPVDYVADVITRITFGTEGTRPDIYHIVAGSNNEVTVEDVVDAAGRCFKLSFPDQSLCRLRYFPTAMSGMRLARFVNSGNRAISIMKEYLPYLTAVRHFDNTNTKAILADSVRLPSFESYVDVLMRYFIDMDLSKRLCRAA